MSIRHYRLDRVRSATSRSGAVKRDNPTTNEARDHGTRPLIGIDSTTLVHRAPLETKGWQPKNKESRLSAYRELAAAGIMEPAPGSEVEYRFTADGADRKERTDIERI